MNEIIAVTPSNIYDTNKMKYLLDSAKFNNFNVDVIGLNRPFKMIERPIVLREYLLNLPADSNPIICYTDAYDVFYLDSLERIRDKFLSYGKDIVCSAEKWYSFQLKADKKFYDTLTNKSASPYKYINGGTFIGYKNSLIELCNNIIVSMEDPIILEELASEGMSLETPTIDQTLLSHQLAKYWNKYSITLDYDCNIFYVASGDWNDIDKYINKDSVVTFSGKSPSIIHVPWKHENEYLLIRLFEQKYNTFTKTLINNKYSWGDNSITFLENGMMDAFGKGYYSQEDTYVFLAFFGEQHHSIVFNNDYTEFISTRRRDNEAVKGKLL